MAMTLMKLFDLVNMPLFDMDAEGFNELHRLEDFNNNVREVPAYISTDTLWKYKDAEITLISWHNCGIAVRFYKGE